MTFLAFLSVIFFVFLSLEMLLKRTHFKGLGWHNHIIDAWSLIQASVVVGPIIAFGTAALAGWIFPESKDMLIDTPYWLQFVAFLFFEDMVQYWWHRSAHTYNVLWPLHRVHHSAPYLGIKIWLRNGFFYVLLMPNLWFASSLIYAGFGKVYLFYTLLKMTVSAAAHSEVRWDRFMYRYKFFKPFAWILERTISTPATHFAHHALNEGDGIGNLNGNFGNLLFFWDVLFGTALISRQYPSAFGIQEEIDLGTEHWRVQLFYPIFRTKRGKGDQIQSDETPKPVLTQETN